MEALSASRGFGAYMAKTKTKTIEKWSEIVSRLRPDLETDFCGADITLQRRYSVLSNLWSTVRF
jgi:hypothetical protein